MDGLLFLRFLANCCQVVGASAPFLVPDDFSRFVALAAIGGLTWAESRRLGRGVNEIVARRHAAEEER